MPRQSARMHAALPPGQRLIAEFPRFGAVSLAKRGLRNEGVRLQVSGPLTRAVLLTATELAQLRRVSVTADFHCAAGWSYPAVRWSGFRFQDVWDTFIKPNSTATDEPGFAILRCEDGYRTALPLADLLVPDVLIVDRLNDQPLTVEHGAPIRLVAPAPLRIRERQASRRNRIAA